MMTLLLPVVLTRVLDFYVPGAFDKELDLLSSGADIHAHRQLERLTGQRAGTPKTESAKNPAVRARRVNGNPDSRGTARPADRGLPARRHRRSLARSPLTEPSHARTSRRFLGCSRPTSSPKPPCRAVAP